MPFGLNFADLLVIVLLAAGLFWAGRKIVKDRVLGKQCCGCHENCGACPYGRDPGNQGSSCCSDR